MKPRLILQKQQLGYYLEAGVLSCDKRVPLDEPLPLLDESIPLTPNALIEYFYSNILFIRVYMDAIQGINTFFQEGPLGERHWLRVVDSENTVTRPVGQEIFTICNYLRIFYSYLLSAIVLAKLHGHCDESFLRLLLHVHHNICVAIWRNKDTLNESEVMLSLSEGKGYLIDTIELMNIQLKKPTINKMLDHVKNWVALERPSFPVCTVMMPSSVTQGHYFAILDDPCTSLTEEQRALFDDLDHQPWYLELSLFDRQLIAYFKDSILSGRCAIPSQLRAVMPICKNAYMQSVWAGEANIGFQLINAYFHTGAVAFLSHKQSSIAESITSKNLLQQKQTSQSDINLMIALNSSWSDSVIGTYEWLFGRSYTPDDSEIIRLTKLATLSLKDQNILFSKLCINQMRMMEFNDYSGIDEIVKRVTDTISVLEKNSIDVSSFKISLARFTGARYQFTPIDFNVKGLDIIYELTYLVTINNQFSEQYPDLPIKRLSIWFGCASGENRTGIVFYHAICSSLLSFLEHKNGSSLEYSIKDNLLKLVAKTHHLHVMTGNQGNSFGTEGVRYKSSGSLRSNYPSSDLLTKSSDIKSLPLADQSFAIVLDKLDTVIKLGEERHMDTVILNLFKQIYSLCLKQKDNPLILTHDELMVFRRFVTAADFFLSASDLLRAYQKLLLSLDSFFNYQRSFKEGDDGGFLLVLSPSFHTLYDCLNEKIKSLGASVPSFMDHSSDSSLDTSANNESVSGHSSLPMNH